MLPTGRVLFCDISMLKLTEILEVSHLVILLQHIFWEWDAYIRELNGGDDVSGLHAHLKSEVYL